ncbi:MAG: metalloregulator ArsR/SmtB family transcription factor [Halieaceae bacterium]|jgi:ArsR family transcriptional regulator|nr:metalloregulator ArsR/SmtB family transcription factor [Halieaceae bacterium]
MNAALTQPLSPSEPDPERDAGSGPQRDAGDEELESLCLASLCKACADPLRLRILRVLRQDAMGVGELCEVLGVRQPALSHHLKLMSTVGLLGSQRDGNHIFYRRNESPGDDPAAALRQALFAAADSLVLDASTRERQTGLQRQREANSRDFFRDNAERFVSQRDLIAAPERYRGAVESALDSLAAKGGTALEIGPGDGWLLPYLSRHFDQVIALDNAEAMLERAAATAAECGLGNIEFILGDTSHERLGKIGADLAVLNMVLHHTPQPAATLREAAEALAPGGVLLVTELCEHQQGWARESCGDLWLGFAPEALEKWAAEAGLRDLASSYLGQRNGFTLQLRLFGAATDNVVKETV